jgi:ribosomal protein S18 acetylase RimI-like enzyme
MNPLGAAKKMALNILPVSSADLEEQIVSFTELFKETVNGGASLGYVAPVSHNAARDYWLSLRSELESGVRLLLATYSEEQLIGAGQLYLPYWPAARHRAEIHKVLVGAQTRGRGVGKQLMTALHETARRRGRSLIMLNTRRGGSAERFYMRLGYKAVGVVPGYIAAQGGLRYDSVMLYLELAL